MSEDRFNQLEKQAVYEYDTIQQTQNEYWIKNRHPFNGGIELTPYCNMKCVHCYVQDCKKEALLSASEWKRIIDKLEKRGVLFLYFTGGEILTRSDFKEIYVYAKKKGFIVELLTNGTLIDQELLDVFEMYPPASVSISVYGKDSETYDRVTQTKGNFHRLINGLDLLRKHHIHLELKYICLKENYGQFEAIEKLANKYEAEFSFTFELFPTLKGDNSVLEHMISTDQIIEFEKQYERTRKVWSANVLGDNPFLGMEDAPQFTCDIATSGFLIDYRGYLNPCNKFRLEEFNLLNCEFDEAWDEYGRYRKMVAPKNYKCTSCKAFYICNPCPMTHFLTNGSFAIPSSNMCELTLKRYNEFSKEEYDCYRQLIKNNTNR